MKVIRKKNIFCYFMVVLCFLILSISGCSSTEGNLEKISEVEDEELLNNEDAILGFYYRHNDFGGWYGEIYRYNGQLLIGNPREWAPSMAIAVVYEDGILRVPGRGSMKVLNNSTISLDESDQPKKDQEGNLIEYKKEFSIKPTMSADKTLMEKYAGKWINDNGGFIIKPSDEGWEIMNIRNELKVYPIQYKNNAFIMTNNSGEENKYVYDVKKNQVIATFKGEEYFYNKIYSIKIDG